MKSPLAIASFAALVLLSAASATDEPRVNGWYPCATSTYHMFHNQSAPLNEVADFECSEIEVPLCYDGVCESDRKTNVFVKRRLGKTATDPSVPRKAVVVIGDGLGSSSGYEEGFCNHDEKFDNDPDDVIDCYTFDQRGTGRSEYLQCDAASALTPGSPAGVDLTIDELPTCLEDLNVQYDGQAAAFSTISAAMDVRMIVDTFLTNHHVYIHGRGCGTYLAQRILQLNIPQVHGYIFDGVDVLTTDDDPIESASSHRNQAMLAPARRLLEFCFDDPKCPLKLKSRETVVEEVLEILAKMDAEPNKCVKMIHENIHNRMPLIKTMSPSEALRFVVFQRVPFSFLRAMGLSYIAQAQRCNAQDYLSLESDSFINPGQLATQEPATTPSLLDILVYPNQLLQDVITLSERWAQPPPTREERYKLRDATPVSTAVERDAMAYCIYTGSTDPACEELQDELPESNVTFSYKRDKYYNEPIMLPDHVSALIFNGGLDFRTPLEFGELLYSKLQGSGRGVMMVNFDYYSHLEGEAVSEMCQKSIADQFVTTGGDVGAIDTTCMEKISAESFNVDDGLSTA